MSYQAGSCSRASTRKAHLVEEAGIGQAGDHTHDLPNRAHLLDIGQLLVQDAHCEVAFIETVHYVFLGVVIWDSLLHNTT